jgi:hypothetical protein
MSLYTALLAIHNVNRTFVLLALLVAVGIALTGWLGRREWTDDRRRFAVIAVGLMDLQLLLGGILYGISPLTRAAMASMKAAMKDPALRFYAVEHGTTMLVALVVGHVVAARLKRMPAEGRFRTMAIGLGITLLLVLLRMPFDRPWFPRLGA